MKNILLLVLMHIIGSNVAFADDTYVKVTSSDQLLVGKRYLIVYASGAKSMALGPKSSSVRDGVSVKIKNDRIVLDGTSTVTPVTLDGNSSDGYTLKLDDGTFLYSNSDNTNLTTSSSITNNNKWTISINNDSYLAPIKNVQTNRYIRYDSSSTSFKAYSSTSGTNGVTLFVQSNTITVSSSAEGLGTFVTEDALDFSGFTDLFAYTATVNGNTVLFNRVNQVPVGTPILVRSTADFGEETFRTVTVPVISSADAINENALVAGTGTAIAAEEGQYYNYVLSKNENNVVGFYLANGTSVVPTTKAYLKVPKTGFANTFIAFYDGGVTSINSIDNLIIDDMAIYDLQGRRVHNPQRGIYIVNGKKVVIK